MSLERNLSRRDLMRLCSAGVFGAVGTGWFSTLSAAATEQTAQAELNGKSGAVGRPKSCILLWMTGGPSHMDTFDLKPGHANGGPFKPVDTNVPGIQISEHLPMLAKQADKMIILRGLSTGEGAHPRGRYLMHTGYREGQGGVTYPSLGALASKELGREDFELPNFVAIGGSLGPGFLGPRHAPLIVGSPDKGVENLRAADSLASLDQRVDLLTQMEEEFLSQVQAPSIKAHSTTYQRAVTLMHSDKARAFDLTQESAATRDAYGRNNFGQGCLLARRLVETGVPFVEVNLGSWDTHTDNFDKVAKLSATVDAGFSNLLADLSARGLLDSTLVIWMGEFGRTPKINTRGPKPGRDHYPRAWSAVLAGGGLKTGQVYGRTSPDGGTVEEGKLTAVDFMANVCKALGIDYTKNNHTRDGRPIRIVDKGENIVPALFA